MSTQKWFSKAWWWSQGRTWWWASNEMSFQKHLRPRFRWALRLQRSSTAFLLLASAFALWASVDRIIVWLSDVPHYYTETIDLGGGQYEVTILTDPELENPPSGSGWKIVLDAAFSRLPDAYIHGDYPSGPIMRIIIALLPAAMLLMLWVAAWITRHVANRLTRNPNPRLAGEMSRRRATRRSRSNNADRSHQRRDWSLLITSVTALGALVFTGLSLQVTRDQNTINAESQITNRYTQAVQLLGAAGVDAQDLRLGGIYALERIARDSSRDAGTIFTLLATFVHDHARSIVNQSCAPHVATDIQAALTIITDSADSIRSLDVVLDLSATCLNGANLIRADLGFADLHSTDLTGANLTGADLNSAVIVDANFHNAGLIRTDLQYADLTGANLTGAVLDDADLSGANLTGADFAGADLRSADLSSANLTGVDFAGADLRSADLTHADLTDANFRGEDLTGAILDNAASRPR